MDKSGNRDEPRAMHLEHLLGFPLSASMRRVIEQGRQLAERERFRGFFGTGLLLVSLEAAGRSARKGEGHYAPTFLSEQIHRRAGARYADALKRFYDNNRLPVDADSAKPEWFSLNLKDVFESAQLLPRHDGITGARHVIVSLLSFQNEDGARAAVSAWELLADAGVDRGEHLAELLESLARGGPIPEQAQWKQLAALHPVQSAPANKTGPSPAPTPRLARGPWIAGYHSDRSTGRAAEDCLNLDATVNAMANLIASPQLDGTLSLGVFGNWGSGKSFFMGRLREAIDEITSRAAKGASANVAPEYWSNVAQVEFNAWHYVDANLWASLMSHLLDVLRRWTPEGRAMPGQNTLAKAIEQLEITSSARNEAIQRQTSAEEAEKAAISRLTAAQEALDTAAKRLGEAMTKSLWTFIEGRLGADKVEAVRALRTLGLLGAEANESLESVFSRIRDVTAAGGRVNAILHQLLRSEDGPRMLVRWGLIAGGAVLAVVVASFWAEWLRNAGTVFATALAGVVAVAAKSVDWIRKHAATVIDQLAPLMAIRTNIELALAGAETEKAALVSGIEQEVATCRAKVAAATVEVATREKEVREAVQAVADAVSGRAVRQFIEQRLAAGDYQKHLGLIATIRRDFEQLSDLIRAHNATRLSLSSEVEKIEQALRRARPDIDAAELSALFTNIGINRIVLYIDDLDRCPSNRVVEVLQAIHLLLSFPIFVVVVGVDSRWMKHSLAREYPSLLTRAPEGEAPARGWSREEGFSVVTPEDYLEKIFQIPFWVPPLTTASAQLLIGKLTAPATRRRMEGTLRIQSNAGTRAIHLGGTAVAMKPDPTSPADPLANDPDSGLAETSIDSPADNPAAISVTLPPAVLVVDDDERAAMQSLAAIIGRSPRATKRFVNSYRLLKAALTDAERETLSGANAPLDGMVAPMFLLAIVTGIPTLAAEYVAMLPANPDAQAVDQLFALGDWATTQAIHGEAAKRIVEFQRGEDVNQWQPLSGGQLRPWVTRVTQFSFEDLVPVDERGGPQKAAS